jgi:photosystem II stability/assembly factor-like uncharacterized protein
MAQGTVGVGHSGWQWGNPQPQGNTLRAVEFAGGTGYAAGDFGTLLRTADNGLTWQGIPTGVTGNLAKIRAVDANTVVIGAGCVMRRSDNGGTTFRRVPFVSSETGCRAGLAGFHFPTPTRGYIALDDGTVQTTSDGGTRFGGATALPGTSATGGQAKPTDVFFTTETTGFVTVGGVIFRTTDGGTSWTPRHTAGAGLNGLQFVSASTGYAVGDAKTILRTTDGGDTWSAIGIPGDIPASDLTSIRCAPGNTQTCLVSTKAGDRVLRITPGQPSGDPADQYIEPAPVVTAISPSTSPIFAISFATATGAVGVGDAGATVASNDVGANTATPSFTPMATRLPGNVTLGRLRATSTTIAHAMGDNGRLARTVDGGRTWTIVGVPTSEDLADAWFTDANTGFAVDTAGGLRFTDDGGQAWTPLDTGTVPSISAVHATDKDTAMLFTSRGIFRSTRASDTSVPATTFERVPGSALQKTAFRDYDRAGTALFAWGTNAIWVSTNKGASWKAVGNPLTRKTKKGKIQNITRYVRVDFVSAKVGYAVSTGGRVWKTTNGGKKWSELSAVGNNAITDVSFPDASNGYITIQEFPGIEDNGAVLRTNDGGKTWRPQLISAGPVTQVETPGGRNGFALSGASNLFTTTTGGDQARATEVTVAAKPSKLSKKGNVQLTVKVSPNVVGATVPLFQRVSGSSRWTEVDVDGGAITKGSSTYTVTVRVTKTTSFVAQWKGDADNNGDGSPVRTVTVKKKKKK